MRFLVGEPKENSHTKNCYRITFEICHGDDDQTEYKHVDYTNELELEKVIKIFSHYFGLSYNIQRDPIKLTSEFSIFGMVNDGFANAIDIFDDIVSYDCTNSMNLYAIVENLEVTWFNPYGKEYIINVIPEGKDYNFLPIKMK